MIIMKKTDNSKYWQEWEATRILMQVWRKYNWYDHFGKLFDSIY